MTQTIQQNSKTYHQCSECKLLYPKKKFAEECEAWCREHKTCNTEIMKRAVSLAGNNPVSDAKEKKAVKREERFTERERAGRKRKFATFAKRGAIAAASFGVLGLLGWYVATRPPVPESEILSESGLHWHPELAIYIDGKREDIPGSIGLGAVHNPIHTHDPDNVIHLEFSGLVRKDDLRLGKFFEVWGKKFNSECIFDSCSGPAGTVMMSVNGKPNIEFEKYEMQDKDKIEIRYETKQ